MTVESGDITASSQKRVCVYGAAGGVGASAAASLLARRLPQHLHLVDVRQEPLSVLKMDLALLAQAIGGGERISDAISPERAREADLVIAAASVQHRDGTARAEFAADNLRILDSLLDALPQNWSGTLVVASNPVEVLTTAARERLGGAATVLGYVRNDSLRLAQAIAARLGQPAHRVEAWAAGLHGPGMIGPVGGARLDGKLVQLTEAECRSAVAEAVAWYDTWQTFQTGLTSIWTTGYGLAELAGRYYAEELTEEPVCLPVPCRQPSDLMSFGAPDSASVCLGVPARIGYGRAEPVADVFTRTQEQALLASARGVLALLKSARTVVGVPPPAARG